MRTKVVAAGAGLVVVGTLLPLTAQIAFGDAGRPPHVLNDYLPLDPANQPIMSVATGALENAADSVRVDAKVAPGLAQPVSLALLPDPTKVLLPPSPTLKVDLPKTPGESFTKACDLLKTYNVQAGECPAEPRPAVPNPVDGKGVQQHVQQVVDGVFAGVAEDQVATKLATLRSQVQSLSTSSTAGVAPVVGPAAAAQAVRVPAVLSQRLLTAANTVGVPSVNATGPLYDKQINCVLTEYANSGRSDDDAVAHRDLLVRAATQVLTTAVNTTCGGLTGAHQLTPFAQAVRSLLTQASIPAIKVELLTTLTGNASDALTQARSGDGTAALTAVQLARLLENLEIKVPAQGNVPVQLCVHWEVKRDGQPVAVRPQGAAAASAARFTQAAQCKKDDGSPVGAPDLDTGTLTTSVPNLDVLVQPGTYDYSEPADLLGTTTDPAKRSTVDITATVTLRVGTVDVVAQVPTVSVPLPKVPVPSLLLGFTGRDFGPNFQDGSSTVRLDHKNCITEGDGFNTCRQGFYGVWAAVPANSPITGPEQLQEIVETLAPVATKLTSFADLATYATGLSTTARAVKNMAKIGTPGVGFTWIKADTEKNLNNYTWVHLGAGWANDSEWFNIEIEDEVRSVIMLGSRTLALWDDRDFTGTCREVGGSATDRVSHSVPGVTYLLPNTMFQGVDNTYSSFKWENCPSE